MTTDFDHLDLFCRVNVQSELSHSEFVHFIATVIGGMSHANSVTNDRLDISVDGNDVFDVEKSRTGKDCWLYFKYTLEIDPIVGVASVDYLASVAALLQSLWSQGVEAVASCDFEEQLPQNLRRLKWAGTSQPLNGEVIDGPMPDEAGAEGIKMET
jgi:hypothetical protein